MRRKTVVVLESGRIPELNICGPIQTPTRIGIKNIAMMVKNGKNVLECDPKDPHNQDKRIKLTTENVGKDNFGEAGVKPAVEPTKVEKTEEKKADEQATAPTTDQKKQETGAPEVKPAVEPAKVEKSEEKKADEQATAPTTDQKKQESNKEKNKGKK